MQRKLLYYKGPEAGDQLKWAVYVYVSYDDTVKPDWEMIMWPVMTPHDLLVSLAGQRRAV